MSSQTYKTGTDVHLKGIANGMGIAVGSFWAIYVACSVSNISEFLPNANFVLSCVVFGFGFALAYARAEEMEKKMNQDNVTFFEEEAPGKESLLAEIDETGWWWEGEDKEAAKAV